MTDITGRHRIPPPPPVPRETNISSIHSDLRALKKGGSLAATVIGGSLVAVLSLGLKYGCEIQARDERQEQRLRVVESRTVEDRSSAADSRKDLEAVRGDVRVIRVRVDTMAESVEELADEVRRSNRRRR